MTSTRFMVNAVLLAFATFVLATHLAQAARVAAASPQQRDDVHQLERSSLAVVNRPTWSAVFAADKLNMSMTQTCVVNLTITYIDPAWGDNFEMHILTDDPTLLGVARVISAEELRAVGTEDWSGNFSLSALFLGHTKVYVQLRRPNVEPERSAEALDVVITRNIGKMDVVFQVCVASFVMILYVNFGAVLDLEDLKRILLRPVGPAIGFFGQFIVMPILSFCIGYFLFRDDIELRLGLFFTGSTPGGGASNIFTVVLNANLNLSITMTAISNLAAFGMMPLWIFTLGSLIFRDGNFAIPYKAIAMMSFSLVVPLSIGIALQKYAPTVAKTMSKMLKPIAFILVVIVMGFGFTVNSYMFKLFSWKIIIASSALPWIGYIIGWLLAIVMRQSARDALTIAIETGIQNTGIAIFMLTFTLPQPQADMTSAVPVANSMMVPLPLLIIYLIRKCFCRTSIEEIEEAPNKEASKIEVEAIVFKSDPKLSEK